MRKAIIAFTKIPALGKTKTRLTEARGGFFTPEESNAFYEAMILDVIDCCIEAAGGGHEFWICHDKDGDRQSFMDFLQKNTGDVSKIDGVFSDEGGSFDECMQYCADYMLNDSVDGRRAEGIIIVGGDLPTMQPGILKAALDKLESLSASSGGLSPGPALVESACQDGGFSLVGFTYTTPFDFYGVFYNTDGRTALDMLVDKAREKNIPYGVVEAMPDIDIPNDLGGAIPVLRSIEIASESDPNIKPPRRTLEYIREVGLVSYTAGE